MHERIAKIQSTFLGIEDHSIFTSFLHVTYGDTGQGIGGMTFGKWREKDKDHPNQMKAIAYGAEFIRRILETVGVDSWEKLPGKYFIVLTDNDSWNSPIRGIKRMPTDGDKVFMFADLITDLEL